MRGSEQSVAMCILDHSAIRADPQALLARYMYELVIYQNNFLARKCENSVSSLKVLLSYNYRAEIGQFSILDVTM